jgi:hypothetical protein
VKHTARTLILRILGLASAACGSGPDPSQGSALAGVQVDPSDTGGNGYTQAVALGSSAMYAAFDGSLARLTFDGSRAALGRWNAAGSNLELAVAADDGAVWWEASNLPTPGGMCPMGGAQAGLWTSSDSTFLSIGMNSTAATVVCPTAAMSTSQAFGLVADASWVILALAATSPNMSGPTITPDSQNWPGPQPTFAPSTSAGILRFDRHDLAAAPLPLPGVSSLATAQAAHVLAQNTQEIYWLDASAGASGDRVMRGSKSPWAMGQVLATAPSNTLTGIAANDQYVVWATSTLPTLGANGCAVFASHADGSPVKLYDGSSAPYLCAGAALDDKYAYVALTTVVQVFPGDPGGPVPMVGTGIGRVPLAGGPLQIVPLASSRWYGARRILVDALYVYAVDPSFVVRVDKSAFGG